MQGGDLLLDLSFWDGRSIALAQEIEPGRADVAFAPDPGIANIACHRTGSGVSESLPRGNSVAVYRRKCYGQIYRPGRAAAIWQRAALPVTSTVTNANVQPTWRLVFRRKEDRKSVVEGKSVSVRVDNGGRRMIKKKKDKKKVRGGNS